MLVSAERIIATLNLKPHPEGGHYAEVFRSAAQVHTDGGARRTASTAIYFLLKTAEFSAFHRVASDELWHHYLGTALELELLDDSGTHERLVLGRDLELGQRPMAVVPRGVWQAARPIDAEPGFVLCGCTVAPGFEFADFELPPRAALLERFPARRELVERLTRP